MSFKGKTNLETKIKLEKLTIFMVLLFSLMTNHEDTFQFFIAYEILNDCIRIPFTIVFTVLHLTAYPAVTYKFIKLEEEKTLEDFRNSDKHEAIIKDVKKFFRLKYPHKRLTHSLKPGTIKETIKSLIQDIKDIPLKRKKNQLINEIKCSINPDQVDFVDIFKFPRNWERDEARYNEDLVIRYQNTKRNRSTEITFSPNFKGFYIRRSEEGSTKYQSEQGPHPISQLESEVKKDFSNE